MKKPSLNVTDFLIIAGIGFVVVAVHQAIVAPKIVAIMTPKPKASVAK